MVNKGKSCFLQNIVEEIRPGCKNLQRSQIMVNLLKIFLGGMMLEVKSGVCVERYGLDKSFFYRFGGGMLLLVRCSQAQNN